MKKQFEIICRDCGEVYESYCTSNELEELLMSEKCTSCGGSLRRSWTFGGYQMKKDATRRPT